ncbi:MAG: polysaccharide biosynthesis protein [Clostridiales bacterium]|nr:polysaccharide biosynthesis protein [Clostridiales bacterium]
MKKKSFVYGAILLTIASIICKIIGAIFRVPLTHLIGVNGVGIYQLVFPVYALFLVIASSGIPVAISKIISKEYSSNNYLNIKILFKNALILTIVLGLIFTILIIIFAYPISIIQNNSQMYILYFAVAPSLFFSTVLSAFRGYFQGFEIMKYSAISQIIEQIFKLIFGLFLAYIFLPLGIIYGVLGAVLGIAISEFLALIYLLICYKKKKLLVDFTINKSVIYTNKQCLKLIVKEALPITLSSIIIPLTTVIDSLMIVKLLENVGFSFDIATRLYGLDSGVVASLINLPSVIAVSLAISLMPSISSSFALRKIKEVENKAKLSLKLIWYFVLPCVLIYFTYSREICSFLYGNLESNIFNQLEIASLMLKFSSFSIIYISINQILTITLQAVNKSYTPVIVVLLTSILKIFLTIILVLNNNFNIFGLVLSDVICAALTCIINLAYTKKYVNIKFKFKEIVLVPLTSLGVMFITLYLFKYIIFVNITNRLITLLSIGVAFLVYLIFVLVLKGFNTKELSKTKLLKFLNKKKY